MASPPSLQQLKNRHLLWHASERQNSAQGPDQQHANHYADSREALHSQYPQLDKKLEGGWPANGVIEMHVAHLGCGELRLILPCLKQCQEQHPKRLLAWVSPPARLNPQALAQAEICLDNMLIATPAADKDSYWVVEQLLRSACCSAMIFWCSALEPRQAKRLQIHAKKNHTLLFIIRHDTQRQVQQSLPLSMRMRVQADAYGLNIDIFKRQNRWPIPAFSLDMQTLWPALYPQKPAHMEALNTHTKSEHKVLDFPFAGLRTDKAEE